MSVEAWLTLVVVVVVVVLLAQARIRPAVVVLGGTFTLLVTGVIDDEQALAGFSNPAPFTVAALYVVAGAVERTGALEAVTERLLGFRTPEPGPPRRRELARILLPVAVASAFLNNTPIVAMVAPRLLAWTRRTGRAASHYLMPLSFATILGGVITTIGTSTNLVVNGLMAESGVEPIGLFELGRAGLPVAAAGLLTLLLVGRYLLVDRRDSTSTTTAAREYTVEMTVRQDSPLAGRSVSDAGLRNLQGVFLVELERGAVRQSPVTPEQTLEPGDRLVFVGDVRRVIDLQKMGGLEPSQSQHFEVTGSGTRRFFEAVVAPETDLTGHTLKSVGFRSRYRAAVVAVHRAGQRVEGKLGEVALSPGDVLLVLSDPGFRRRSRASNDFLLVSELSGEIPVRREGARLTQAVVLALIVFAGSGVVDILTGSLLAAGALIATRVISVADARDSLQLGVLALIAGSFGLGAALTETGLAQRFADALSAVFAPFGDAGIVAGVLLTTAALTAVVNNNASAVLMWPIVLATATAQGLDPRPLAVAIMLGASMDFLTPVGYQTNTMVFGMGGYKFSDFPRLGLPLTVVTLTTAVFVIPIAWPL